MVAISLYRGNLHRVSDVPRRWLMPKHRLSLRDFKALVHKRTHALARRRAANAADLNGNNSSKKRQEKDADGDDEEEGMGDNECSKLHQKQQGSNNEGAVGLLPVGEAPSKPMVAEDAGVEAGSATKDAPEEKAAEARAVDANPGEDALSDKEKRKVELENKLHILKEKKHQLVQTLKQILNAEEEIKKRSAPQMPAFRAPVPPQMEATRIISDGNINGDLEAELEDTSNQNAHARHINQMHGASPSVASPLRKPVCNMDPLTVRTSFAASGHIQNPSNMAGVSASPSRFAPSGHQGHTATLPPISVSGAHTVASSPSPAASSGTSVFRDARLANPFGTRSCS